MNSNIEQPNSDCLSAENAFGNAVAAFKDKHSGSLIQVNLMTDPFVARAVAAWPSVPREIKDNVDGYEDPWDMIWYAPGLWMDAARIPRDLEAGVMLTVIQNHLVYPDGTMPQAVRAYLVQKGRELLGLPPPKKS